ncbi:MAG: 1-acyl-sn-glycerol-3-phosphate acyltransferase [Bacteroidales bacterium]|nr:1-acyl-sn-glycerol-3-phosphate acyltransferase [Bacteroidales bacterium]MDY3782848.1 1-acyl-sn-glycerol-3-phosphate acyltransferase [Candidatus Cryptobacteroides sp.]
MTETRTRLSAWSRFCGWLLKTLGWTAVEPLAPEDKAIILGVPHTSIWDFFISYLYYKSMGGNAKCMVKKEMFFPPLGWILKAMGAFPVDRTSPTRMLHSVIHAMEAEGSFHLAIAPEGTRKPVKNWKTGFHTIAHHAGVPVYLGYFDWKRKRVGRGQKFELTDDARADMARIQKIYEDMDLGARHPKNYITH